MYKFKGIFSKKKYSTELEPNTEKSPHVSKNSISSTLENQPLQTSKLQNDPFSNSTLIESEPYDDHFNDAASYHSMDSISNSPFGHPNRFAEKDNIVSKNPPSIKVDSSFHTANPSNASFRYQQNFDFDQQELEDDSLNEILPPSFNKNRNKQKIIDEGGKNSEAQKEERLKARKQKGEEMFQNAVIQHEQGNLVSAAAYFKRSADIGNPSGLLFFGLCLRHGWGCKPNEKMAFLYLQKAGETVVPEAKSFNAEVSGAAKKELSMAIFELGQSYYHGWGVSKNRKTAIYYYRIAADLGDPDAQTELATCYEHGDGIKRDMKIAAHYYRLAGKQGIEQFGNSWIYKKKYDSD
ncbi:hypothetical protein BB561_005943 [Smittium simulii]|uniref:HCP-like protein n=1 Tax=Smittium simulii TaxID=133385 RepID=A0A2T9Y7G7_9FUNG|nr:hypothetical protein BB561_005943 [Smittium simulii]